MFEIIRKDIEAYQARIGGSKTRRRREAVRAPGVHAVVIYRFGHWLLGCPLLTRIFLEPLYLFLYRHVRQKWGIEIQRNNQIGEGFVVQHQGGVFIGPTTIGKNVVVHQDVVVGFMTDGNKPGAPHVGDNVIIAPGAKLFGNITIGNNVRIGPNAVVLKSVPNNAFVAVLEPRVVILPGRSNREDKLST